MTARHKTEQGFTLLELLMVVIIIAILASIALPQYFRVTERSRTAQSMQLLASIRGSELRFRAQSVGNVYDNSVGLGLLDIAPLPPMASWGVPAANGNGAGSNVTSARVGGTENGALLHVDLDTGNICATGGVGPAATTWGVPAGPC